MDIGLGIGPNVDIWPVMDTIKGNEKQTYN